MKKTEPKKKTKFGYKVDIRSRCVHHESDGQEYGSYSAQYENSLQSVVRAKSKDYPDLVSDFEFKNEEPAYLVWYEYSTGDSFGHSHRGGKCAMGLFKTKDIAEELAKAIRNWDTDSKDAYSFKHTTSDGQSFSDSASWVGYFEYLEEVHVECVYIK